MDQKSNKKISPEFFQKKTRSLSPVTPSHNHAGIYEGKVTHILLTKN